MLNLLYMTTKNTFSPHTGLHYVRAKGLLYTLGNKVEMEDFWAFALWALRIWLYLVISLIMIPAMFGFSLGISETYMTILVKTLEVLLLYIVLFLADLHAFKKYRYFS